MNGNTNRPGFFPPRATGFVHVRQPLHSTPAQAHPFTGYAEYAATSPRAADQLLPHGGGGAGIVIRHVSGRAFL